MCFRNILLLTLTFSFLLNYLCDSMLKSLIGYIWLVVHPSSGSHGLYIQRENESESECKIRKRCLAQIGKSASLLFMVALKGNTRYQRSLSAHFSAFKLATSTHVLSIHRRYRYSYYTTSIDTNVAIVPLLVASS